MQKVRARASRQSTLPGTRIRWRVFARFLAIFAATTTITVLAMLVAQRTLRPVPAGWAVVFIELAGSGAAALLLTAVARPADSAPGRIPCRLDCPLRENEISADPSDDLFAEVIPTWQTALSRPCRTAARKRTTRRAAITRR